MQEREYALKLDSTNNTHIVHLTFLKRKAQTRDCVIFKLYILKMSLFFLICYDG